MTARFVNLASGAGQIWVRSDLIEAIRHDNGRATVITVTGAEYVADPAVTAGDILLRAVGQIGTEGSSC